LKSLTDDKSTITSHVSLQIPYEDMIEISTSTGKFPVTLRGEIPRALIQMSAENVQFGFIQVQRANTRTVVISNPGKYRVIPQKRAVMVYIFWVDSKVIRLLLGDGLFSRRSMSLRKRLVSHRDNH
jgi:hypothetical protein